MYTLLHNNRCSKSRIGLKNMENSKKNYVLREYLKNPLDYDELKELQEKLWVSAIDFTRIKEKEFKTAGLTKESTDEEILRAMVIYPKLMERPIVFNETQAVIWRPDENIINFVK